MYGWVETFGHQHGFQYLVLQLLQGRDFRKKGDAIVEHLVRHLWRYSDIGGKVQHELADALELIMATQINTDAATSLDPNEQREHGEQAGAGAGGVDWGVDPVGADDAPVRPARAVVLAVFCVFSVFSSFLSLHHTPPHGEWT